MKYPENIHDVALSSTSRLIQDVLDWISPPTLAHSLFFTASDALELHRLGRQVHVEEGLWWKGEE